MPVYTYHCENCGHEFDRQQSFEDSPLIICPKCRKHTLQKVYRPAGVVFKGSGFYVTDKQQKSSASSTNGTSKKEKDSSTPIPSTDKSKSTTENKVEKSKPKPKNEE